MGIHPQILASPHHAINRVADEHHARRAGVERVDATAGDRHGVHRPPGHHGERRRLPMREPVAEQRQVLRDRLIGGQRKRDVWQ